MHLDWVRLAYVDRVRGYQEEGIAAIRSQQDVESSWD